MKLLRCYLKDKLKPTLLFLLYTAIFAIIFYLYSLPGEPVLYAGAICIAAAFLFAAYDFSHYYRKHIQLVEAEAKILYSLELESLPPPSTQLEQDYTDIIEKLYNDKRQLISEYDAGYQEMTDYYTLWAHQIKTPISAMHLILQSGASERDRELSAELFKTEQYVEMVLSYLRLGSDYTDYIIVSCPLDKIVRQAVRKYAPLFIRTKTSLKLEEISCEVVTDEKWLTFVIEQILSNTVKYSAGKTVIIRTENEKTLVIEDSGIGIAEEDLPRVFEKGFTGYNGRIGRKSTGIGLYLCKRILEKLSHTITIESKPESGTTVKIDLHTADTMYE